MTGFRHSSFRYKCTNSGCYIQNLPSWDYLDGSFPRGIIPTDIDGMVEVNGHFLFIEQKGPGAAPNTGQSAAFRALSMLPNVKVAIIRPGANTELELNVLSDGVGTYFQPISRDDFVEFCRAWSADADEDDSTVSTGMRRENVRLLRDNEMLRRQLKALLEGGHAA